MWRWLVLFFTRPIALSDVRRWVDRSRSLARGRRGATPQGDDSDFAMTRLLSDDARWDASRRPGREGVDVSEQPLHTLPAELQDELLPAAKRERRSPDPLP
jgi:hypothetical protein